MNKTYSLGKLSQHKVTYCQKSKLIAEKYFWVTINMHDETCKALVSTNLLTTLRNSLWNISLNPLLSFPLTPSGANLGLPPKNEDIFAKWTTSVVLCHYVYKWFIKMIYIHVRYVASVHGSLIIKNCVAVLQVSFPCDGLRCKKIQRTWEQFPSFRQTCINVDNVCT